MPTEGAFVVAGVVADAGRTAVSVDTDDAAKDAAAAAPEGISLLISPSSPSSTVSSRMASPSSSSSEFVKSTASKRPEGERGSDGAVSMTMSSGGAGAVLAPARNGATLAL